MYNENNLKKYKKVIIFNNTLLYFFLMNYNWVPFHIVACSSEDFTTPADYLSTQ